MPPRRSTGEYTDDWKSGVIQSIVKRRAGHRCETCGVEFEENSNWSIEAMTRSGRRLNGGCHHIDHNRANNNLSNLVYLCQRCHLDVHRWSWSPGRMLPLCWRHRLPPWIVARKLPYVPHPQLELPFDWSS